jgi:hypothetical protein
MTPQRSRAACSLRITARCGFYHEIIFEIRRAVGANPAALSRPELFRKMADLSVTEPPKFKFFDHLRPPCSRCGRPLVLTRIEPWDPGFDLRIYYCAHCAETETVISAI